MRVWLSLSVSLEIVALRALVRSNRKNAFNADVRLARVKRVCETLAMRLLLRGRRETILHAHVVVMNGYDVKLMNL